MITDAEKSKIKRKINKELLTFKENVIFIVDTREQMLNHILKYFQENKIEHIEKKLNTGDYSFIYQGEDFSNIFSIDRKKDINEFVGNFYERHKGLNGKKIRSERFHKELERAKELEYFSFCIENGRLFDIYEGNYRSQAKVNSSIGMFSTINNLFQIDFIQGLNFGHFFYNKVYYYLRSRLIQQEINIFLQNSH